MQKEAEEIFRDIEKKSGKEILHGGGLLYLRKKGHPDLDEMEKYGLRLNYLEMR